MPKSEAIRREDLADPVRNDDEAAFEIVELLFFAYRDFTSDPDAILDEIGFGRAHHRVVHFVGSRPGMSVAALLETLGITKQSLARVLKQLIDAGYVRQTTGPEDRRQRRLFLSEKGESLRQELLAPQMERIEKAFSGLDGKARRCVKDFLSRMCNDDPAALCGALLSAHEGEKP